jgi:peptidoglycan/xylan/chitin deacetylase (PgdA/CDA1 family)
VRFAALALVLLASSLASAQEAVMLGPPPPPRLAGSAQITGSGMPGYVTFTFDDGPNHETTPSILNTLDYFQLKATFFLVGQRFTGKGEVALKNRLVLEDTARRGHLIANHTFEHLDLRAVSSDKARRDMERGAQEIAAVLGESPIVFRPPFGNIGDTVKKTVALRGWVTVLWSVDTNDWRTGRDAEALRKEVVAEILKENGGVVLFHDTKKLTAKVFPLILADLAAENCKRLAAGGTPILPVELDFFARDAAKQPLPVPPEVQARADATLARMKEQCAAKQNVVPTR